MMGNHPKGKTKTVGYLWPHHRSMSRAMVAGGLTPGELAVAYNFTPCQVTKIINSPLFQSELARLEAGQEEETRNLREDILRMSERAIEVIDEDLQIKEAGNKQRQKAAFDILDRAGFGTKRTTVSFNVGGDLVGIKQDIRSMKSEELHDEVMGMIDAEYEEVG